MGKETASHQPILVHVDAGNGPFAAKFGGALVSVVEKEIEVWLDFRAWKRILVVDISTSTCGASRLTLTMFTGRSSRSLPAEVYVARQNVGLRRHTCLT